MKVLHLFLAMSISAGFAAFILYVPVIALLQGRVSTNYISEPDRSALTSLQNHFQKCVKHNGFGLQAVVKDICRVTMKFPSDTVPKWRNPKTGKMEGLSYDFNICETLSLWEQVRNSSTILTKEYIDFLPNGWHDYAWTKINKGIMLNNCENKTLCMEKLSLVLPETPPFTNHQYGRCAIVGNSGDLLKTNFGKEIDQYDAVIRNNGAPTQNYTEHSGKKCTFRLLNRGSAKALDKVAKLDEGEEAVLIVKTTIHDSMSKMIQEVPIRNPVYLMLGMSLGPAAKGTGLKAIEFALSLCQTVDIYGFTVDPGYTEWTRYFSESRGGHTPLQGRAYYQMMECLGLISIHSPMRDAHAHIVKHVPEKSVTESARIAYERTQRKQGSSEGECSIWATRGGESKKWSSHLKALRERYYDITRYPLHHSNTREMLCIRPNDFK